MQRVQIPGPDIIAMTPQSGNFAVVECTTKHLGSDKKLPDLGPCHAEKLRRKLDAAGQTHRTIFLKILVTTLRSEDIAAEREDAERLGVLVLTKENIEMRSIDRLLFPIREQYVLWKGERPFAQRSRSMKRNLLYRVIRPANGGLADPTQ